MLFGATILGRGITPNRPARALLDLYNAKGVFNNREDDLASLSDGLRQRFDQVEIETIGLRRLVSRRLIGIAAALPDQSGPTTRPVSRDLSGISRPS